MSRPRRTGKRAIGRQPKHGARALARHLAAGTLDRRTWVARALTAIREELASDAGGWEKLGGRERLLIDRTAAAALIVESIERWLFQQDGPVQGDGQLLSVLSRGYVAHLAQLTRCLSALGLRPEGAAARLNDGHTGVGVLQVPAQLDLAQWSAAAVAYFSSPPYATGTAVPLESATSSVSNSVCAATEQKPTGDEVSVVRSKKSKWRWGW